MIDFLRRSFRTRLLVVASLISIIVVTLMTLNSIRLIDQTLRAQAEKNIRNLEVVVAAGVADRLASRDYVSLRERVQHWSEYLNNIAYVVITDDSGHTIASVNWPENQALPAPGESDGILHMRFPVRMDAQQYGFISAGLDIHFIQETQQHLAWQTLLIGLIGTIVMVSALSILVLYMTRRLHLLAEASSTQVAKWRFDPIPVYGTDEVAAVTQHFNVLSEKLQRYIDTLRANEERSRAIADYTYSWENWFDPDGKLLWVNQAVKRDVGYTPEECLTMSDYPLPLVHMDDQKQVTLQMQLAQKGHSGQDLEFRVVTRSGHDVWMAMSWQTIYDANGASLGYRSSIRDVSQHHRATEELNWQADHDYLTGLYNRRAFERNMRTALESRLSSQPIAILYVDLDQFKLVNDSCGHMVGDQLLIELAQVLKSCIVTSEASHSILARLGGDEFGVLLTDCEQAAAMACAYNIVEKIRNHPFSYENHKFRLGVSVGVAMASPELGDFTELLIAADTACYAAKEHGRNRVELYTRDDKYFRLRQEEFSSIGQIMTALERGRFVLYVQQMKALQPGLENHAEILIRLKDENDQVQAPARFIEAAERFNLMPYIDRWVVENTCHQLNAWAQQGIDCGVNYFAINVSGSSLSDTEFSEFVRERISRYHVNPQHLCFEITESYAVGQLELALEFIESMHAIGAKIALDDFGSGLSSFAYLKRFEVDYLKIDGMFVRNLDKDATDRAMVATMVQLANIYGLETIVEFVHNEAILDIVHGIGCAYAQGYACHVPEPLVNLAPDKA